MTKSYDKHYKTENYFGEPYPELISFFRNFPERGKLLDLGCGQGRNAIPLAQLGYDVTGIDSSKVGVQQMLGSVDLEIIKLTGIVDNIYEIENYSDFNFILLDSMFHFLKKDRKKETNLVKRIISNSQKNTVIAFCLQNTKGKVNILNESIDYHLKQKRIFKKNIKFMFSDSNKSPISESERKIVIIKTS